MKDNQNNFNAAVSKPTVEDIKKIRKLNSEIDLEFTKPDEDVDTGLIKDNVDKILSTADIEISEIDIKQQIVLVKNAAKTDRVQKRKTHSRRMVKAAAIAGICVFTFTLVNLVSVKAFKVNLFEGVIEFGKDKIIYKIFDIKDTSDFSFETSKDDPYGLIKECQKYDLSPLFPTYIPAGCEIVNFQVDEVVDIRKDVTILFKNGKAHVGIDISIYLNQIAPNVVTPSGEQNLNKLEINGMDMYVLSEDKVNTATFIHENSVYSISSTVDYSEFVKMLESIK